MINKIPKIIHYIWVGGKEKSELAKKCIESWRKYCPDYQIIEWNESNFDMNQNLYLKQAYQAKKFAFVSDYMRLKVLYDFGGIYMDTDVEVVKPLDEFLKHNAFSGFENQVWMPTAVMGAEKHSKWIERLLAVYDKLTFLNDNGSYNLTTNVTYMSIVTQKFYKVKLNNTYQELDDGLVIYPNDWFCPKDYVSQKIMLTDNTHAIHHFNGSWLTNSARKLDKLVRGVRKFFGEKIFKKMMVCYLKKKCKQDMKKYKYLLDYIENKEKA